MLWLASLHENYKANGWTWNIIEFVVTNRYSDMLPSNLETTPWLPAVVFLSYLLLDFIAGWTDNSYWRPVHSVIPVICDLYYTFDSKLVESSVASHDVI